MKSVLVLCSGTEVPAGLLDDLKGAGAHVVGATSCATLVQDSIRCNADLVVAIAPAPSAELFTAAAVLASANPVAFTVFTDDIRVESMEHALDSGIHSWVVRGYRADRLRTLLQMAQLRCARECQQRSAYGQMSQRLEERKLVDRAKGILMNNRQMAEPEAFRILRDAAMHGKERVGQVAQRLIDAASNAEAINRAGQLRMLSQRLVKLQLLAALGVDPAGAKALHQASIARLVQNLNMLAGLLSSATFGDLLASTTDAWTDLEHALSGGASSQGAQAIDAAAETLLAAAEQLTAALESASPVARTRVINLSGRQRMLSQRYAKLALLHAVANEPQRASLAIELSGVARNFEEALQELRLSPLTGALGLEILKSAERSWTQLVDAKAAPLMEPLVAIARCSEELLEQFDRMTEDYEHSLNVLVS